MIRPMQSFRDEVLHSAAYSGKIENGYKGALLRGLLDSEEYGMHSGTGIRGKIDLWPYGGQGVCQSMVLWGDAERRLENERKSYRDSYYIKGRERGIG